MVDSWGTAGPVYQLSTINHQLRWSRSMTSLTGRLGREWAAATRAELGWLLGCALLFWLGKWAGKWFEGIPGHAALFWVPSLYLARGMVPRAGAGAFTALLGGGLWCLPNGNSLGLAGYVAAGLALDALAFRRPEGTRRLRRLPWALAGGAVAAMAKFGFHNVPAAVLGAGAHFLAWGMGPVAVFHLLFGLAGGFLGWLLLRRLKE
jgi:hypothetical protein